MHAWLSYHILAMPTEKESGACLIAWSFNQQFSITRIIPDTERYKNRQVTTIYRKYPKKSWKIPWDPT
jgi:hypothetical protein